MRKLLFVLVLLGCHPQDVKPSPAPSPTPAPVTSPCEDMCKAIGPDGLKCEEGQPTYDSDLPGPAGVPNQTCTAFCEKQQDNGVNLHPSCVAKVKSCDEIETARQHCES
jgi:hypothetical protein